MSNNLQTRDGENQEVDSSEQYAINSLSNGVMKSADKAIRTSKKAIERAKSRPQSFKKNQEITPVDAPPTTQTVHTQASEVHTSAGTVHQTPANSAANLECFMVGNDSISQSDSMFAKERIAENPHTDISYPGTPTPEVPQKVQPNSVKNVTQFRLEVTSDCSLAPSVPLPPANLPNTNRHLPQKSGTASRRSEPTRSALHSTPQYTSLHVSQDAQLNTWGSNPLTSGLQNQGTTLAVAENSTPSLQSAQTVSQATGNTGASATANTAAPGVGVAIQATEKVVKKARETVHNIAASAPRNTSTWGALAALFFLPILVLAAIVGAFRGGGAARNVGLSADVLALMPQVSAACQANDIPEYAPLVAAVIM